MAAEANLEKHLTFGLYKRAPKTYSILPCYHFQEKKNDGRNEGRTTPGSNSDAQNIHTNHIGTAELED